MSFEGIVHAIDAALTGWAEDDGESNAFFGELVESGGGCFSQFNLIFVVARLTVSVEDMDSPSEQLSYARKLEEDLAWFVDSLQQRPNGSVWKDLLQGVRIIIDEVADDVEEDTSDKENEDPEEMKEAQVEDKSASTSAAQDADNKNEAPDHPEEMKDTSLDASIIDEAADDIKEDSSDKESEDPEEMKEAQVEDKVASTSDAQDADTSPLRLFSSSSEFPSDAQDADNEDEDLDHPEEMKDAQVEDKAASTSDACHACFDPCADEIVMRKRRSEDGSDQERDVFKNGQKDGDDNELDTLKKGVSSEKRIGGSIKGTDDGKGEADGGSEKEIEGPAVKKMKQQALEEGDNNDTQVFTHQENLKDQSLKVRSTFPFAC